MLPKALQQIMRSLPCSAGLPTSFGLYQNSWPISLDTAFLFVFAPLSVFHIHGQVGSVFSFPVTQARIQPEVGLLTLLGAELFNAVIGGDVVGTQKALAKLGSLLVLWSSSR